jgi:hypothetical protein
MDAAHIITTGIGIGAGIALVIAAFVAGHTLGIRGIRQALEAADKSKPFLDAVEGAINNVPPEVVDAFADKLIAALALGRALATTEDAQTIADLFKDIVHKVTDGAPNQGLD